MESSDLRHLRSARTKHGGDASSRRLGSRGGRKVTDETVPVRRSCIHPATNSLDSSQPPWAPPVFSHGHPSPGRQGARGGGDSEEEESLASAEIYDPIENTWTDDTAMLIGGEGRSSHSATLMRDGKVLVAGGLGCADPPGCVAPPLLNTAQICDPASNAWSAVGGDDRRAP